MLGGFGPIGATLESPLQNWSDTGGTVRDQFRDLLEAKHPYLLFCEAHWKTDTIWIDHFGNWKQNLIDGPKKKRKHRSSGGDSDSEGIDNASGEPVSASANSTSSTSDPPTAGPSDAAAPSSTEETSDAVEKSTFQMTGRKKAVRLLPVIMGSYLLNILYAYETLILESSGKVSDVTVSQNDTGKQKDSIKFTILETLRERVETLPESIPIGPSNGRLSQYSGDPSKLTEDITDDDMLWELRWDSDFDNLLPVDNPAAIHPLVLRGQYGLIGVMRDRGLGEFLLLGKVERLLKAIDEICTALDLPLKGPAAAGDTATSSTPGPAVPPSTAALTGTSSSNAGNPVKKQISSAGNAKDKVKVWKWKISEMISAK
ncbi:hypothetical protein V5O48_013492 [Marasmius crinis-equi]|uniref:Uncharacterized protein n=1 Tax=Marasmius crinis-equi TaxID=585013 RepID=A0ABR3EZX3_9AGAR